MSWPGWRLTRPRDLSQDCLEESHHRPIERLVKSRPIKSRSRGAYLRHALAKYVVASAQKIEMISIFHKVVFGQRDAHRLGIVRVRQDVIKLRAPELHGNAHGLQTAGAERIAQGRRGDDGGPYPGVMDPG